MKCPFAASALASQAPASSTVTSEVNDAVNGAVMMELSRRGVLQALGIGLGALALPGLAGCASESEESEDGAGAASAAGKSFYADVDAAIAATPITVAPPGPASSAADIAAFKDQAGKRGKAIAGVIAAWLQKPYSKTENGKKVRGLFEELFDSRTAKPIFVPQIGPALVFQHAHVTEILLNTDAFTVDPYAPVMQTATSGNFFPVAAAGAIPGGHKGDTSKGFYNHYMLGTDNDALYIPDSLISRRVVNQNDTARLRKLIRGVSDELLSGVKKNAEFDAVELCRFVPVRIVMAYLGVPGYKKAGAKGEGAFDVDGLKAGDAVAPEAELLSRFKLQAVTAGVVPTEIDLYLWIKDAFQNTFNNLARDPAVAAAGLKATELLLIWTSRLMAFYKKKLAATSFVIDGTTVPDTMLTRLLVLQNDARNPSKQAQLVSELGCANVEELLARTADDRVQANLFGVVVGAVANPEEANGRILQSLLQFREGKLPARPGDTSYAKLKALAVAADGADLEKNMREIGAYALEFLRVNPQGETLLRKCIKDTVVAGVTIKAGTLVFNCHGAAMQDAVKVPQPGSIDAFRKPELKPYSRAADARRGEAEQSLIYLQHGYGRHKCLGRYASEITMQEILRAVLRKDGDITRVGGKDLEMDDKNLYAKSFVCKFT